MLLKNTHIWLPDYLNRAIKRCGQHFDNQPKHIIFSVMDHFEPRFGKVSLDKEIKRVHQWTSQYEKFIAAHKDSYGNPPLYNFFYPIDEYSPECLELLGKFCQKGYGEIEVHLHHDNDTDEGTREKLEYAKAEYVKYGGLGRNKKTDEIAYAFIHGNWALDNSRPDGRWCGVNNEISILKETGCYADFTMPSAPSNTQTTTINSIYYATDDPHKPKSHNRGINVEVGKEMAGDLMIVQGPLCLNWKERSRGIFPRIENGGLMHSNPVTEKRVDLWIDQNICVQGKEDWIFVKVYNHGTQDPHLTDTFFKNLDFMYSHLETRYNTDKCRLHYATARQMYNMIKAAEQGEADDPENYRDYLIKTNSR